LKLSVVILNYNVRYFLEQCILSVQRAIGNLDAEIIVIDNNSSDDSCMMVRNRFPNILLIENKENVGFSKANNQAVKLAKGDYVCILNPDTAVAEDTFIKVLNYADSVENLGGLGVHLMDGTGSFLPESKRNVPTPLVSLMKLMGFGKSYYALQVPESGQGEIEVLVGAFILLKKSIYVEIGGFDEDYFMYGEDIDFSYKLTKKGYKNQFIGSVKVLHYKGESTLRDKDYLDRFYGAMKIFYRKHFRSNTLLNGLVNFGVYLAKIRAENKTKGASQSESKQFKNAYVLTENLTLLKKLSMTLKTDVSSASKLIFSDENITDCLFIFDVDYMSYTQIFSVMKKFRNKGNIFRIRPSGCDFILGSDQSHQKGVVEVF
jgi:GT2 family glycosyltransferase